jgi:hypothetical protein
VAGDEYQPVAVSRRICAAAHDIFQVLADPGRHRDLDGSGMLRGVVSSTTISGVGDVDHGAIWARAMARTLERLDALCTRQGNHPSPAQWSPTSRVE